MDLSEMVVTGGVQTVCGVVPYSVRKCGSRQYIDKLTESREVIVLCKKVMCFGLSKVTSYC